MNEHDTAPGTADPDREKTDLILEPPATQPVTAAPTITYPTLPPAYTRADDAADESPAPNSGTTATARAAAPTAAPTAEAPIWGRRPVRVRTVVFGLVLLTISVISLISLLTDVRIDGSVVGLGMLIGAGVALLAGGMVAASREAKGGPGATH